MWTSVVDEFRRSPITTITAVCSVVVSALSLGFANQISALPSTPSIPSGTPAANIDFNLPNCLVAISFFIATTFLVAFSSKMLARKHAIAAFFLSILLVSLENFATILVMYLAPPRMPSIEFFTSANDLVFYASSSIFIAFFGKSLVTSTLTPTKKDVPDESMDLFGSLFFAVILLCLWGSCTFAGQTRLSQTFLPETAQPRIIKNSQSNAISKPTTPQP